MFGERVAEGGGSYGEVQCLVLSGGHRKLASEERRLQGGAWRSVKGPGYGGVCE